MDATSGSWSRAGSLGPGQGDTWSTAAFPVSASSSRPRCSTATTAGSGAGDQKGLENTKIKLSPHTSAEKLWGGGESCNSLSWMNEWIQDSNKTYQSCSPWRPPALQLGVEELPRGQTQPRDSLGLAWVQTLPPPTITPHATSCQQRWQQEAEPWSSRNLHLALPRGAG